MLFVITGHGAKDPGATGNGYQEAERVRALAQRIKAFGGENVLISEPERNYYKDNGISKLTLPKDTKIIELHMDSGAPTAKGAHVIINGKFSADEYDKQLAEYISGVFPGRSKKIVGRTDLANINRAATKGYNYRLLECGFITNVEDIGIFNDRMDEIAKGILSCFGIGVNESVAQPATQPAPQPVPAPQISAENIIFTYAVRLEDGRVLPEVRNLEDFAGIRGKRITDVAVKVNTGKVKYQVHVLGGGWLPWVTGYNWNDHNSGYAGNGRPIDAIRVYYETPADYAKVHGYKKAQYHVSPVNGNYYSWQYDNETSNGQDGYAGCFGKAIDRFQLW